MDTLQDLFEGNESLFRSLAIYDVWDWETSHPVIRLNLDGKYDAPDDLANELSYQLESHERRYGIDAPDAGISGPIRFRRLIERLYGETGRSVVVLIDEYDKPILDVIQNVELARRNRDYLRGFTVCLKAAISTSDSYSSLVSLCFQRCRCLLD